MLVELTLLLWVRRGRSLDDCLSVCAAHCVRGGALRRCREPKAARDAVWNLGSRCDFSHSQFCLCRFQTLRRRILGRPPQSWRRMTMSPSQSVQRWMSMSLTLVSTSAGWASVGTQCTKTLWIWA